MRNIYILFLLTFLSVPLSAQNSLVHIPASKTLVGIWKQTGVTNPRTGEIMDVKSGNYKVINADGTYYTFITWGIENPSKDTGIGQYGTYKVTSENTLVENIVQHTVNPMLNGKNSILKFELIDDNTLMMAWSPNTINWVKERWTRLPLSM
ncbi:protein of unknown function [Arenibacter nanhaiticus]|uniref:DUF4488 domain-containing protein n=1 Tax=Arenibacter nanhaiticus TaxID=558155 RepID=A0A1M6IFN1_9FLAO|nr:DUF4488 domain-containing protein [Arenibacter nanhaiticus]SHJ33225.1 protein of unknown function [Arenibacter nanhaiticus]